MNDEVYQVGCEAIKILRGETKQQAMQRLEAEGQVFAPKHQDILGHNIIEQRSFHKKYRLHLAGMRLFMWNYRRHPVFRISLKNKRVELRYRPKLVHFQGNEALLMFDKRRPRALMKWLRLFAAVIPMRMAIQDDPAPNFLVCRVPSRVARMFLTPTTPLNG